MNQETRQSFKQDLITASIKINEMLESIKRAEDVDEITEGSHAEEVILRLNGALSIPCAEFYAVVEEAKTKYIPEGLSS